MGVLLSGYVRVRKSPFVCASWRLVKRKHDNSYSVLFRVNDDGYSWELRSFTPDLPNFHMGTVEKESKHHFPTILEVVQDFVDSDLLFEHGRPGNDPVQNSRYFAYALENLGIERISEILEAELALKIQANLSSNENPYIRDIKIWHDLNSDNSATYLPTKDLSADSLSTGHRAANSFFATLPKDGTGLFFVQHHNIPAFKELKILEQCDRAVIIHPNRDVPAIENNIAKLSNAGWNVIVGGNGTWLDGKLSVSNRAFEWNEKLPEKLFLNRIAQQIIDRIWDTVKFMIETTPVKHYPKFFSTASVEQLDVSWLFKNLLLDEVKENFVDTARFKDCYPRSHYIYHSWIFHCENVDIEQRAFETLRSIENLLALWKALSHTEAKVTRKIRSALSSGQMSAIEELAYRYGINSMYKALDSGVPLEDVLASF